MSPVNGGHAAAREKAPVVPPFRQSVTGRPQYGMIRAIMTDASSKTPADPKPTDPAALPEPCPRCGKRPPLCVCEGIEAMPNRIELLILQYPQEKTEPLGTARLAALHLQKAQVKIGLSWPSLAKALGRPVDPGRWAVLYLGSAAMADMPEGREVVAVDAKSQPLPDQKAELSGIDGVILLDGSWSQAKTLWWRNPWVLKCRRLVLNPATPSAYGRQRKEPRKEALSTLESAALLLSRLEKNPGLEAPMRASFEKLLAAHKDAQPKRDWRRRPGAKRPAGPKRTGA